MYIFLRKVGLKRALDSSEVLNVATCCYRTHNLMEQHYWRYGQKQKKQPWLCYITDNLLDLICSILQGYTIQELIPLPSIYRAQHSKSKQKWGEEGEGALTVRARMHGLASLPSLSKMLSGPWRYGWRRPPRHHERLTPCSTSPPIREADLRRWARSEGHFRFHIASKNDSRNLCLSQESIEQTTSTFEPVVFLGI